MNPERPTGPRPAPSLLERLMPPVMDARDLYRRRARAYGVLAAVIFVVGLLYGKDEIGIGFTTIVAALLGVRAFLNWRRMQRAGADEKIVRNVDGLPVAERAPALRRIVWLGGSAAAALSAWTAWTLWELETGRVERATVWGPAALVYRYAGFWPAVLTWPALGVLIVASGWAKMRKLEEAARAAPPSAPPSA
jgi:hypothetical protein